MKKQFSFTDFISIHQKYQTVMPVADVIGETNTTLIV